MTDRGAVGAAGEDHRGGVDENRRWGLFEPPASPPASARLRIGADWSPARLSWGILASVWRWVLPGSLLLIVFNVGATLLPLASGRLVDTVVVPASSGADPRGLAGPIASGFGMIVGLYVVIHVSYRFGGRLGWHGVQLAKHDLTLALVGRIVDERGLGGGPRRPGALLSLATADVARACSVLAVTVYPPGALLGIVAAGVVLAGLHPALGWCLAIGLPVVLVLMWLAARPLRRRSVREQEGVADAAGTAADLLVGFRVVRGLHAQREAASRYRTTSRRALRSTLAARRAEAAFDALNGTAALVLAVVVVVIAALLAYSGELSVGGFVAASGIAVGLAAPIESLSGVLGFILAVSQASSSRVLELLHEGTPVAGRGSGTVPSGEVPALELRRLALGDGEVDTVVAPGEFVVLDASPDAARRLDRVLTLQDLPERGAVRLASVPLEQVRPRVVRERLLVAPRVPGLFEGSVLDNVRADGPEPLDADDALDALAVTFAADDLPSGPSATVGEGGLELSGGQRQRVALARALAARPPVLVLFDPTSSVDAVTEQRVAEAAVANRAGLTTVVVTSSPAFRAVADRIVVVGDAEDGAARERGGGSA